MENKEVEKRINAMASLSAECINHRGNGSIQSNFSEPIIKYIEQLEKALDKACEQLEKLESYCMDIDELQTIAYEEGDNDAI